MGKVERGFKDDVQVVFFEVDVESCGCEGVIVGKRWEENKTERGRTGANLNGMNEKK